MDKELKFTVGIVTLFVVVIIGLAFLLDNKGKDTSVSQNTLETTKQETEKKEPTPQNSTSTKPTTTSTMSTESKKYTRAVITTNKGVIEVDLLASTPKTTTNFGTLASSHFYDGVRFHRVIKGFMIQGGDPLSKDPSKKSVWGTGGPGYKFEDELTGKEQYPTGTLAMANAGPNTNGSQFFIVTAQPGVPLPPSYTVFGKVTKGLDVALAIENVATNSQDQPLEDVVIEKVEAF
jgi:cyclophilin family peptidyl-prolyl cis-trans isomerase